jgi:hypothetical protein
VLGALVEDEVQELVVALEDADDCAAGRGGCEGAV